MPVSEHDLRPGTYADVDVLVIGAGVAGLVTALDILAAEPTVQVAILDKGVVRGDAVSGGSTPLAQGGLAAAVGADDSPELHAADTIRAGDGLCDARAVAVVTSEGPDRVADLMARGAVFDRESGPGSPLALAREGGQRVARSVRAADATGAEIARALRASARGRVRRIQGMAADLAVAGADRRVVGAYVLLDATEASGLGPPQPGGPAFLSARATVLATGGCGGLYASTTNPDSATADGVALAYGAGAQLSDMEFVQFHPTGLKPREGAGHQRFLLTEALRGAGATLRDHHGTRFMLDRHPDAELAPRYVVTKAILEQPGGVWLDATSIPAHQLREEFPTVLDGARRAGFDLESDLVPVEPCQHYMIGGVATDLYGRTTVPGLWAAGEVACSGVHGANRMAGNSLLQASVFGHRVAQDVVARLTAAPRMNPAEKIQPDPPVFRPAPAVDAARLRDEVRMTMSAGAGAVRSQDGLSATAKDLARIREETGHAVNRLRGPFLERDLIELHSAVVVASLITESALLRTESRGVHWRDDHRAHEPLWEGRHLRIQAP